MNWLAYKKELKANNYWCKRKRRTENSRGVQRNNEQAVEYIFTVGKKQTNKKTY